MIRRRRQPVDNRIDPDTRAWLVERVDVETAPSAWPGVMPAQTETKPRYDVLRCQHCQGVHFRACPRVREIEFHENGQTRKVVYWKEGEYDDSDVIWPEHVFIDASEADST